MEEIWKDISDYKGLYQVSNLGNIKSLKRYTKIHNANRLEKEKILKLNVRNGYYIISLNKKSKRKVYQVHRLVASAFIPNLENKLDQLKLTSKNIVRNISDDDYDNLIFNILSRAYFKYKQILIFIKQLMVLKKYAKNSSLTNKPNPTVIPYNILHFLSLKSFSFVKQ